MEEQPNVTALGKRWVVGVAVVTALASAQALGLFGGGSPTVFAPCPLPFVFIAFSPVTPYGVPVLVAVFVAVWCWPLVRGNDQVPTRTIVLAWIVGITSIAWYVAVVIQDLQTASLAYSAIMAGASTSLAVATLLTLRQARRHPAIWRSALAHGILFVWLVTYSYPWFGEVP